MKTFSQTRATFLAVFAQLERLEGPERATQALRRLKEREIGRLCYQAEEDFPQAELSLLKDMLDIKKNTWDAYKRAYRENLHL